MIVYVYRYRCLVVCFTSHVMIILGRFSVLLPVTFAAYRWFAFRYDGSRSILTAGAVPISGPPSSGSITPIGSAWIPKSWPSRHVRLRTPRVERFKRQAARVTQTVQFIKIRKQRNFYASGIGNVHASELFEC